MDSIMDIVLSEDYICKLRESKGFKDIIDQDELEKLEKKWSCISTDKIRLGRLVIECYDLINKNLHKLKDEFEEDVDLLKELKDYLNKFDLRRLRDLLSDFDCGQSIGDYYIQLNISEEINKNLGEYQDIINNFFKIFSGDDV